MGRKAKPVVDLDNLGWEVPEDWRDKRDESAKERFSKKIKIEGKTPNQKKYIETIENHIITLVNSVSGVGKTFCAIGIALKMLQNKEIEKIIITRPMVEAGRQLGAMPGDLNEKYEIYMRPIYDNMLKFITQEQIDNYKMSGKIEFLPLEVMRGCSIDNAFMFLDEAQNVKKTQMLMFLTRIGENTKVVIAGDLDQMDWQFDGFQYAIRNLIEDDVNIGKCELTEEDIMRSDTVKLVLKQWRNGY